MGSFALFLVCVALAYFLLCILFGVFYFVFLICVCFCRFYVPSTTIVHTPEYLFVRVCVFSSFFFMHDMDQTSDE